LLSGSRSEYNIQNRSGTIAILRASWTHIKCYNGSPKGGAAEAHLEAIDSAHTHAHAFRDYRRASRAHALDGLRRAGMRKRAKEAKKASSCAAERRSKACTGRTSASKSASASVQSTCRGHTLRLGSTRNVQEARRESGWGDAVTQLRRPFSVWRAQAGRRAGQQQTSAYAQVATFHVHTVRSCGMANHLTKQVIDTRACCRGSSPAKKDDIMLAGDLQLKMIDSLYLPVHPRIKHGLVSGQKGGWQRRQDAAQSVDRSCQAGAGKQERTAFLATLELASGISGFQVARFVLLFSRV
jgi:hypothetical protein